MASPGGTLWPEHWAIQADLEADRIQHRLEIATARPLTTAEAEARTAVLNHVAEARAACRRNGRRRGLRDRWRGTSVERAFVHLHAAKIFLVDVLPDGEFAALIPEVSTRLGQVLDRNDPRRVDVERLMQTGTGADRRAAVKQAMETAYDASDEEYVRLRDFRNIIALAALAVTALTALLIFFVAEQPQAFPLCFSPDATSTICPSGDSPRPTGGDILVIAALGALGGVLGGLVAIRRLRGTSTPYSVSTALAVLKVPSGALAAVIGMLLLTGGFIPGLTSLDSRPQILAYALIFGLAQHIVTRVADNRAQEILDGLPSKDSESRPAQPPVVAAPGPAPADQVPAAEVAEEEISVNGSVPAAPLDGPPPPAQANGAAPELPPVQAASEELPAAEAADLATEIRVPADTLEPEESDEFPDDDGEPEVDEDEAAQTGVGRHLGV